MAIDKIIEKLNSNLATFKPIPFWSWNEKLDTERLTSQIDKMKTFGMGGYFMHARSGLITEYLSKDWMRAVEVCSEYGKSVGLTSWLYDENGYPSGFAGGKLLENEEYHDQYLTCVIGEVDSTADINYLLSGEELVLTNDFNIKGEWVNIFIHNSVGTADVLNGEVTNKFIELTHEKYKNYFGSDFSKKITGIFTDEPQYYRGATSYTRVMKDYYYEKYNENLFEGLGLLFVKKKGWRTFRYRYWKCMQELLVKNYAEKVYDWCEKNNIKFTGHYVEESSLGMQMAFCGGVMSLYEYMHIPGIDWLGANTDNELSPRQVSSVAAQLGKKQILTESFACCGWQVKPKSLKRIAEFQFVNGVNLLCHHLVPYSEYGVRKHDHPAHYSSINPWIDYEFKSFNDYFTKLGYLISESEEYVNVAVLHPIRSAYFDYNSADYGDYGLIFGLAAQDKQLREDLRSISSRGINYHFLDETLMGKYGFVNGDKIGCGKKEYDFLILPHITTMDSKTEKLLAKYVQNGGKILILGEKPEYIEGEPFEYLYLSSNCSFEDIIGKQSFKINDYDTEIYVTYRKFDEQNFIFAQNASKDKTYTQLFDLGDKVKSFKKLNLETLETPIVPLSITLEPEESALLVPSDEEYIPPKKLDEYVLTFDNATAEYEYNNLVVDKVSYSTDGLVFSEKYPCEGLIIKLGKEKYKGEIYFKYEFQVKNVPEKVVLRMEQGACLEYDFNGSSIQFEKKMLNGELIYESDITSLIKLGKNEYTVRINWFQSEKVEYILQDDNINGSLGNMLTYDTEISPIYICGNFGVYSENFSDGENGYTYADDFYIGRIPSKITEPVYDGLPFFSGRLTLKQSVEFNCTNIGLRIPGTQLLSYIKINGQYAGRLMFNNVLDISKYAKTGRNDIEVDLIISNRNLYGPFHFNGVSHFGVGPHCWDMRTDEWDGNNNKSYRRDYELLKLNNEC